MYIPNCCFICASPTDRSCKHCSIRACSDGHLKVHGDCFPFRIEVSSEEGRHFVASRDIEPGETILIDEASVLGPATKAEPICLECLKPLSRVSEERQKCSCGFYFCSDCIGLAGGRHERECKQIEAVSQGSDDGCKDINLEQKQMEQACIFFMRFWSLRKRNPEEWDRLNFLDSGDTTDLKSLEFVQSLVSLLQKEFGAPELAASDIYRMMGIKRTNASNLASIGLDGAVALYSTYTLMNSSCFANTLSSIDPNTFNMRVKASRCIKIGEQIFTRYVPPMEGQPTRGKMIWNGWKFICRCERCRDPTEFSTWYSAVKCIECEVGRVLPKKSDILSAPWQCEGCGKNYGSMEIEKIIHQLEVRIHGYFSNEKSELRPSEFISQVLNKEVHLSHFLVIQVKSKVFFSDIPDFNKNDFDGMTQEESRSLSESFDERIRFGEDILEIANVLDPGKSGTKQRIYRKQTKLKMQYSKLNYCMNKDMDKFNEIMLGALNSFKKSLI